MKTLDKAMEDLTRAYVSQSIPLDNTRAKHFRAGLGVMRSEMESRQATLFDAIKHGDANHQAWLKGAISAHFSGKEIPKYVPNKKDEAVKELIVKVKRLRLGIDYERVFSEKALPVHVAQPFYEFITSLDAYEESLK